MMTTLGILLWYVIGVLVVRYTDNGTIMMISHFHPKTALLLLFFCWTFWPSMLLLFIINYLRSC